MVSKLSDIHAWSPRGCGHGLAQARQAGVRSDVQTSRSVEGKVSCETELARGRTGDDRSLAAIIACRPPSRKAAPAGRGRPRQDCGPGAVEGVPAGRFPHARRRPGSTPGPPPTTRSRSDRARRRARAGAFPLSFTCISRFIMLIPTSPRGVTRPRSRPRIRPAGTVSVGATAGRHGHKAAPDRPRPAPPRRRPPGILPTTSSG